VEFKAVEAFQEAVRLDPGFAGLGALAPGQ
jgi:hypothetical protein